MSNREEMKMAIAQTMQPDPQQQQLQQIAQQMELQKAQAEIKETEASAMKDFAHAAKFQSEVQDKTSENTLIKEQMEMAEKMAKIEKLRTDSENTQSETMRNIPEVEHLQSETILNLAKARMAGQGKN